MARSGFQLKLQGIGSNTPHGNRGKFLETMLDHTHQIYEMRGLGMIYHIPNAYRFCSKVKYDQLPPKMKAITGEGDCLQRVKTPADYIGHYRGLAVSFDAKEFEGASLPLKNIHDHQITRLWQFEQSGGAGGFLCYSKREMQAYWISAKLLRDVLDRRQLSAKSLSLEWLTGHARFTVHARPGELLDWGEALRGAGL